MKKENFTSLYFSPDHLAPHLEIGDQNLTSRFLSEFRNQGPVGLDKK